MELKKVLTSERALTSAEADTTSRPWLSHGRRVARFVRAVAEAWGVSRPAARRYQRAACLHDIGKATLPAGLLRKPDSLTPEEVHLVRLHPIFGDRILSEWDSDLVDTCRKVARSHHERWDGTGYPDGLRGAAIPVAARLTAVADVVDALVHSRPYRDPVPVDEAFSELRAAAGTQLDPEIVDVCVEHRDAVLRRYRRADSADTSRDDQGWSSLTSEGAVRGSNSSASWRNVSSTDRTRESPVR